jgi:NAD(P)-dependent dehydrogenase (short-subunit alcohol dehydrogenase family)
MVLRGPAIVQEDSVEPASSLGCHYNKGNEWVALITGGGVGIGRAIAKALVAQQAGVAICGRRVEELERTAGDFIEAGGEVLSVPCDVTQRVDVERTMKRVIQKFGRLNILVNNAGVSGQTPIPDPDESK